jgi:cardiolipin synthase
VSLRWIPDAFTIARVFASPLLAWLLLKHEFRLGLLLVAVAGATDWLDGFSARKLGVTGKMGVVLDPLADKTLLVTLFLSLGALRLVPLWMLGLAIGRDLVIVIGSLLLRIFRNRRKFVPTIIGKVSTFFQIVLVLLVLIHAAAASGLPPDGRLNDRLNYDWLWWLETTALVLTAIFTALSGLDYVRKGIVMTRLPPVPDQEYVTSSRH